MPVVLLCHGPLSSRIIPLMYPLVGRITSLSNFRMLTERCSVGVLPPYVTRTTPASRPLMIVRSIALTPRSLQLYPPRFVRLAKIRICASALPIGLMPLVSMPAA